MRSVDVVDGKKRKREFFAISKEDAYSLFEAIAEVSGTNNRLHKWDASLKEQIEEDIAEEHSNVNRHHFKEIKFYSSLTNKEYMSRINENGTLGIIDVETGNEVQNNSNPSKRQIVGMALEDLGEKVDKNETLYQRFHRLTKLIEK